MSLLKNLNSSGRRRFGSRVKLAAFILLLSALFLPACGSGSDSTLWIYGASSLQDVLTEMGDEFSASENAASKNATSKAGANLKFQFGGSSRLIHQINEGAESHILAVANEAVLAGLNQPYEAKIFASSEIVIAVAASNPHNIKELKDLENAGLILGVCAVDVPCGSLAVEVFRQAGVELKPDTRETSARAVMNKLLLGELDVGLIYKTDVIAANRDSTRLKAIELDELPLQSRQNDYLAVILNPEEQSESSDLRQSFINFLTSADGKKILASHGFITK